MCNVYAVFFCSTADYIISATSLMCVVVAVIGVGVSTLDVGMVEVWVWCNPFFF